MNYRVVTCWLLAKLYDNEIRLYRKRKIIIFIISNTETDCKLEIRSMERGICPIATLALHLTLYSLTGSRFDP